MAAHACQDILISEALHTMQTPTHRRGFSTVTTRISVTNEISKEPTLPGPFAGVTISSDESRTSF